MKKYLVSVVVAALMASSTAFGQGSQGVSQEQIDEFLNMYFDQFASVGSGRYVDERCHNLSSEDYSRLVNNIETAKSWLQTFVDPQTLETIDIGARQIGMDAVKIPCGPESVNAVDASLQMSENLATIAEDALLNVPVTSQTPGVASTPSGAAATLSEQQQAQVQAATEAMIERYNTVILGWHVEQKCRHLGNSLDGEYDSNKTQIEGYIGQMIVPAALQQINRDIENQANAPAIPACGRDTFDMVENGFRISRQFLAYLKQLQW